MNTSKRLHNMRKKKNEIKSIKHWDPCKLHSTLKNRKHCKCHASLLNGKFISKNHKRLIFDVTSRTYETYILRTRALYAHYWCRYLESNKQFAGKLLLIAFKNGIHFWHFAMCEIESFMPKIKNGATHATLDDFVPMQHIAHVRISFILVHLLTFITYTFANIFNRKYINWIRMRAGKMRLVIDFIEAYLEFIIFMEIKYMRNSSIERPKLLYHVFLAIFISAAVFLAFSIIMNPFFQAFSLNISISSFFNVSKIKANVIFPLKGQWNIR